MNDNILIDRENELKVINNLMANKQNIIVFGQEGVGKSAIAQRVLKEQGCKNNLYVQENHALRQTLTGIITAIPGEENKSIDSLNILALRKKCYAIIESAPHYIILDHVGKVQPRHYTFLAYIVEKNIPLLIISRGLDKKAIGHLRVALYNFEKIEIKNFNKTASNDLIDYFMKAYGIKVTEKAEFKHEVFSYSKGNPKIIKALCSLARDVKYQKNNALDVKLMNLDRRINETVH